MITNFTEEKSSDWYVWRVIRNLSALGHIEVLEEKRQLSIFINNPSIVRLPSLGKPTYVLTGARYPGTLDIIENKAKGYNIDVETISNTIEGIAPDTIILKIENDNCIRFCNELSITKIEGYAAYDIGKFAISCEEILSRNFKDHALTANNFKSHFDLQKLKFTEATRMTFLL